MIRNLLFDLGGVIMDLKRSECVKALESLGMKDADTLIDPYTQRGPFLALENGSITPARFRDEIRSHLPAPVTDKEIDDAFNRFLVGIPESRLDALSSLKKKYRVYMLSNTNPIMWDTRIAEEFRKQGHDVNYYFDGIVTSFEARCVKPATEIFETVVRKFGVKPDETLFFDDSAKNIEAASRLGFKTALVPEGIEFLTLIPQQ